MKPPQDHSQPSSTHQAADAHGNHPPPHHQRRASAARPVIALHDLHQLPPTLSVEAAAEILGCGRTLAYELIRRGEFPCRILHLGDYRFVVPTAELLRSLGINADDITDRGTPPGDLSAEPSGESRTSNPIPAAPRKPRHDR